MLSNKKNKTKLIFKLIEKINSFEEYFSILIDSELASKTVEFKDRYHDGESLERILIEAFAVTREASKRILGMRHYEEQLFGGIVLHQGRIAEMKTGEGKTLVATLPAYLNALSGRSVHIVTVNDYLASRDYQITKPLFDFLGLTSGVITEELSRDERREIYKCDIVYGTNNQFGFDYLNDNLVEAFGEKVQRDLSYCLIDEADSVLIDEARTPLIISAEGEETDDEYKSVDKFIKKFKKNSHYKVDEKTKSIVLTQKGIEFIESKFKLDNYADTKNMLLQHYITQSLQANYIMRKDIDYIIKDDEVIIVDEFTGRIMNGQRFSNGLHQALEAKENLEIKKENLTLATITLQNYFMLYKTISGMTGTGITEEAEFNEIYHLDVVVVPTHKPIKRIDFPDVIFKSKKEKYTAILMDVVQTHKKGQPILIGTANIENSEKISNLLKENNIEHKLLNAKYFEQEAEIISCAGELNSIIIATNMAGRGTDIKVSKEALEVGGLKIIGTEKNDSKRVDNQLRGRAGRQGDVGESIFYVSFEDDLLRIFQKDRIKKFVKNLDFKENEPLNSKLAQKIVNSAQKSFEAANFDSRKNMVKYDNVIDIQRKTIYKERDKLLNAETIEEDIIQIIEDVLDLSISEIVTDEELLFEDEKTIIKLIDDIKGKFSLNLENNLKEFLNLDLDELKDAILKIIIEYYKNHESFENSTSANMIRYMERNIFLKTLDIYWVQHVEKMEYLKKWISYKSYIQKKPEQEYQMEGSILFKEMLNEIRINGIKNLFNFLEDIG